MPVSDKTQVNGGLLFKETVCRYGRKRIGNEVIERAVSGVLNLCDVLQLIIDRFYQNPFSQQDSVCYAHQGILHVVLHFGYQLYAAREKILEQCLANIPFVCTELILYVLQELFLFQRFTVIHISGREHEIEDFPFATDNQVQFEAEEPSHGTFSTLRKFLEGFMNQYALSSAYTQRGGIHKADTGSGVQQNLLDEDGQLQQDFFLQLHKTVIGHTSGEKVGQMLAGIFLVIMLETSENSRMKQDQVAPDFRITHPVRLVPMLLIPVLWQGLSRRT